MDHNAQTVNPQKQDDEAIIVDQISDGDPVNSSSNKLQKYTLLENKYCSDEEISEQDASFSKVRLGPFQVCQYNNTTDAVESDMEVSREALINQVNVKPMTTNVKVPVKKKQKPWRVRKRRRNKKKASINETSGYNLSSGGIEDEVVFSLQIGSEEKNGHDDSESMDSDFSSPEKSKKVNIIHEEDDDEIFAETGTVSGSKSNCIVKNTSEDEASLDVSSNEQNATQQNRETPTDSNVLNCKESMIVADSEMLPESSVISSSTDIQIPIRTRQEDETSHVSSSIDGYKNENIVRNIEIANKSNTDSEQLYCGKDVSTESINKCDSILETAAMDNEMVFSLNLTACGKNIDSSNIEMTGQDTCSELINVDDVKDLDNLSSSHLSESTVKVENTFDGFQDDSSNFTMDKHMKQECEVDTELHEENPLSGLMSPIKSLAPKNVCVRDLNSLVTCGICKGYLVDATTSTSCLHSYCKSCIVKHVHIEHHIMCPTCDTMIHPSDPFANLRLDSTMQDIVYKLLPQIEKDEQKRREEFYKSRGLPWPPRDTSDCIRTSAKKKRKKREKCVGVIFEHIGTSEGIEECKTLEKSFVLVPLSTDIKHMQHFLARKLCVNTHSNQVVVFADGLLTHPTVLLRDIQELFFSEEKYWEKNYIVLQYGVTQRYDFFEEDPNGVTF